MKLDAQGRAESWQSTPKYFLFHHHTLIRVYKAKLADELRAAGVANELLENPSQRLDECEQRTVIEGSEMAGVDRAGLDVLVS